MSKPDGLTVEEVSELGDSFWDQIKSPASDKTLLLLIVNEIRSVSDGIPDQEIRDKVFKMKAWVNMLDFERMIRGATTAVDPDSELEETIEQY